MPNDTINQTPNPTPNLAPTQANPDNQNPPATSGNDPAARTSTGELKDARDNQPTSGTEPAKPEADPNKPAEPAGPPEKYEFKAADGQQLDAAAIDAVSPIFKELGLTQSQADKLVGFYNTQMADLAKRGEEAVNTMREGWRNQIKADKEMGSQLDTVTADIGRMKALLPEQVRNDLNEALNLTGAGDHPAVAKALWQIAKMVIDGKPVPPGNPSPFGQSKNSGAPPSLAAAMYPNLPQG